MIDLFKKKITGTLLSFILASVLMMVWYGYFVIHANDCYTGLWGDGYKNYYTFAYYVAYGHGTHFSGMNYPFGEHVIFTDDQPALAFIANHLGRITHSGGTLHGVFTICMYLSIPVCAVVLFLIFSEFAVGGWYAIFSAAFISLLSPQIDRIGAHFGLSYCFVIPVCIWLLIRCSKHYQTFYLILLIAFITFFGLIHIYHMAILSAFVMAYSFIYFILSERSRADIFFSLKLFMASIMPFLIIKFFLILTDPVADRPDHPWGFLENCVTYDTVFLCPFSFIYTFIASHIDMPLAAGERWAYIGLTTDLLLIFFLFLFIARHSLAKKLLKYTHISLSSMFCASIIVLLFSFGLPFKIRGLEKLFDYTGPLKQFRAPCRFAWIFYYGANIFVIVFLFHFLHYLNIRKTAHVILFVVLFTVWFIDINVVNVRKALAFHSYGRIFHTVDEANGIKAIFRSKGLTANNFQAMLYLPFFSSGSEKTSIIDGNDMLGMKVSLYSGLGMVETELSRTSLSETNMGLQLMSDDLVKKEILKAYPGKKPLLLVVGDNIKLSEREKKLISKANSIGKSFVFSDSITLYTLPLSAFDDSSQIVRMRFEGMISSMQRHTGYLSTGTMSDVITNGFDDRFSPFVRFGKGALYEEAKDIKLYDSKLPGVKDSAHYEFSIWNYGDHRVSSYPSYVLEIFKNKERIKRYEETASRSVDVFGKWVRTSIQFVVPDSTCTIKITGIGKFATYDELMIRPLPSEVLTHYEDKDLFMYNNYPITKK